MWFFAPIFLIPLYFWWILDTLRLKKCLMVVTANTNLRQVWCTLSGKFHNVKYKPIDILKIKSACLVLIFFLWPAHENSYQTYFKLGQRPATSMPYISMITLSLPGLYKSNLWLWCWAANIATTCKDKIEPGTPANLSFYEVISLIQTQSVWISWISG